MEPKDQALDVWGEFGCFSRPEFKVERFSYPVITPSAARGIYDAIYCKPNEFRWQVTSVEIFETPSYIALRRNEVKEKASVNAIDAWMKGVREPEPIWADGDRDLSGSDQKGRTQRQTMALRNVRYRLHAQIRPWPKFENGLQGMEMQFRRRAANGKCVYQPYFGCREFPAYFELAEPEGPSPSRLHLNLEIGFMLYDVFDLSIPGSDESEPSISLFQATVQDGILNFPEYESPQVYKGVRGDR